MVVSPRTVALPWFKPLGFIVTKITRVNVAGCLAELRFYLVVCKPASFFCHSDRRCQVQVDSLRALVESFFGS